MTTTNESTTQPSKERGERRQLIGIVTSNSMEKTITVAVNRKVKHPLYEKFVNRRTKIHAHDESGEANVGDKVVVVETRPLSKSKRFRLHKILTRAVQD